MKLRVEEYEGERRMVDTVLGEALGYERPRVIRELGARLRPHLLELGPLPHRTAMVEIGSGALRSTVETLYNQAQVNYLITRYEKPRYA